MYSEPENNECKNVTSRQDEHDSENKSKINSENEQGQSLEERSYEKQKIKLSHI